MVDARASPRLTELPPLRYLTAAHPPRYTPTRYRQSMLISSRGTVSDRLSVSVPRWVVFTCGGGRYGVPATAAREILEIGSMVRVPGCGPEVAGLGTVRGRVVSIFDLGRLMGDPTPDRKGRQVLICGEGGYEAGLLVDRVLAVVPSAVAEPEGRLPSERIPVLGMGRFEERPFTALDAGRLLAYLFE